MLISFVGQTPMATNSSFKSGSRMALCAMPPLISLDSNLVNCSEDAIKATAMVPDCILPGLLSPAA